MSNKHIPDELKQPKSVIILGGIFVAIFILGAVSDALGVWDAISGRVTSIEPTPTSSPEFIASTPISQTEALAETKTPTPSMTPTSPPSATPTETFTPTKTNTPSATPTHTPTSTETSTPTPSPAPLSVGGKYEDDRISLELFDFRYGVGYPLGGVSFTASKVAYFEFCNKLPDVFNLSLKNRDFMLIDSKNRSYPNMSRSHIKTGNWNISGNFDPGVCDTFNVPYDGDVPADIDYFVISLDDFSSLGDVEWIIYVEN